MALLYPRLDGLFGHAWLEENKGSEIDTMRRSAASLHPAAVYAPTGGTTAPSTHLDELAQSIRATAAPYGFPDRNAGPTARVSCDRALAVELHRSMDITPAEASAREVWTFMAVSMVPDVVAWRFGFDNEERWVASDLTRHALGRLWWQAYTLGDFYDGQWNYDLLSALSESDLNQVFERRTIGGMPTLVRAIARAVQIVEEPEGVSHRSLFRDANKRLLRAWPFTSFLALADDVVDTRVRELFAESARALESQLRTADGVG